MGRLSQRRSRWHRRHGEGRFERRQCGLSGEQSGGLCHGGGDPRALHPAHGVDHGFGRGQGRQDNNLTRQLMERFLRLAVAALLMRPLTVRRTCARMPHGHRVAWCAMR